MKAEKESRKYYEAYEDRYLEVHGSGLKWFHDAPTPIVGEAIELLSVGKNAKLLEIGCGEGRDAIPLLESGYDLLATDVSPEAIRFCREKYPLFADRFEVLDCVSGETESRYDFIFAVAVLHMLVGDEERAAFYRFIRTHLSDGGAALICTMGDGEIERQSDTSRAFELGERVHAQTGRMFRVANTSCRMISFDTFDRELRENGFEIIKKGMSLPFPDFSEMMFAIVK